MEISSKVDALAALAQESRLAAFRLLVEAGFEGLPAGVIAQRLGIPPATLSFHLAQLSRAGLVSARREGRSIIYVADFEAMNALVAYLTENCCRGRPGDCVTSGRAPEPGAITTREVSAHEAPARTRRRQGSG